jgi:hypothetical protein
LAFGFACPVVFLEFWVELRLDRVLEPAAFCFPLAPAIRKVRKQQHQQQLGSTPQGTTKPLRSPQLLMHQPLLIRQAPTQSTQEKEMIFPQILFPSSWVYE